MTTEKKMPKAMTMLRSGQEGRKPGRPGGQGRVGAARSKVDRGARPGGRAHGQRGRKAGRLKVEMGEVGRC